MVDVSILGPLHACDSTRTKARQMTGCGEDLELHNGLPNVSQTSGVSTIRIRPVTEAQS